MKGEVDREYGIKKEILVKCLKYRRGFVDSYFKFILFVG